MSRRLGALIAIVALTSGALFVGAIFAYPIPSSHWPEVVFWIALAIVGSSLAVRMPDGSVVDVSFAPIVAAMSLGGPALAGWVALVGVTQPRELRRQAPWYGVVANHATITGPAVASAFALTLVPSRSNPLVDFAATFGAACLFFSLNSLLTAAFVSAREGESLSRLVRVDAGAYASMLALAPVAWLMAQMFDVAPWAVLLFIVPVYTTRLAYQQFVEVREMFTETIRSLAGAVDRRDPFTGNHSRQVQTIAMDLGRAMKVSDADLEALEWGGLLHDIGKIGIRDAVLLKPGRLTRDERIIMNSHPVLGAEIIAPVRKLAPELPIIRHHHEWFNGSGYPDRLVGNDIPKLARILHVADSFEAMTAARPYRMTPLTLDEALAELHKFRGIQFDPDVVDAFMKTRWAREMQGPARPEAMEVPLIGQAAGLIAAVGRANGDSSGAAGSGDAISAAPGNDPERPGSPRRRPAAI
ncbi:MAG: HD-GYP domain-containing protein [Candidatus Limnocylindrales bacterium]|jgi:putative nucleotidyltransferase with HDIG domain